MAITPEALLEAGFTHDGFGDYTWHIIRLRNCPSHWRSAMDGNCLARFHGHDPSTMNIFPRD